MRVCVCCCCCSVRCVCVCCVVYPVLFIGDGDCCELATLSCAPPTLPAVSPMHACMLACMHACLGSKSEQACQLANAHVNDTSLEFPRSRCHTNTIRTQTYPCTNTQDNSTQTTTLERTVKRRRIHIENAKNSTCAHAHSVHIQHNRHSDLQFTYTHTPHTGTHIRTHTHTHTQLPTDTHTHTETRVTDFLLTTEAYLFFNLCTYYTRTESSTVTLTPLP